MVRRPVVYTGGEAGVTVVAGVGFFAGALSSLVRGFS